MAQTREIHFTASESRGQVTGWLSRPADARWLLVMGHGAGAGPRHVFLETAASRLADRGIATFRYAFPYAEKGGRRPDPRPVLLATVRSAVDAARREAGDLPLLAGGKSMGGRMTSLASAEAPLPGVAGIAFFGFPLHPAGRPPGDRAEHLAHVKVPMLFLQGTRDRLADLDLLRPVCAALGERAQLHVVEGADHSFHVLKRSGRTPDQVMDELADAVCDWAAEIVS
ncbi:MAG: alpha/beta hydrolase family protein [Myxococcota bacterium]